LIAVTRCEWRILESVDEVSSDGYCKVGGGRVGHIDLCWKPREGLGDSSSEVSSIQTR
jgi:hypothetical protein